eukprot:PhF_6_TR11418/c0_g1_i1/m.18370
MSKQVFKQNLHKGPRQRFMNKTAFDPNKYKGDFRVDHDVAEATKRCCLRCTQCITWKINYGKYKPQKDFRKCHSCNEKTVGLTFHHVCQTCAEKRGICSKCEELLSVANANRPIPNPEDSSEGSVDEDDIERIVKPLEKERDRRSVRRLLEKGKVKAGLELAEHKLKHNEDDAAAQEHGDARQPAGLVKTPEDSDSDEVL